MSLALMGWGHAQLTSAVSLVWCHFTLSSIQFGAYGICTNKYSAASFLKIEELCSLRYQQTAKIKMVAKHIQTNFCPLQTFIH